MEHKWIGQAFEDSIINSWARFQKWTILLLSRGDNLPSRVADLELHSALSLRLDSAEKHASVFHLLFFFFLEKSVSRVVHYLRDSQIIFSSKIFIKNWSHNTIHIFKNYFTTVFLVFSFQKNKRYLNTPFIYLIHHFTIHPTSMPLFFKTQLNTIHLFIILSLSLSLFNPQPHDLSSPVSLSSSSSLQPTATNPTTQCTIWGIHI